MIVWSLLLGGGVLVGAGLLVALVAPRPYDRYALAVPPLGIAVSLYGFLGIVATSPLDVAVAAAALATGATVGGYMLAAALLPSVVRERAPEAVVPESSTGESTRLVFLASAEPEGYRPARVVAAYQLLRQSGVRLPSDSSMPFVYASEKARYAAFGPNPARDAFRRMAERVAAEAGTVEAPVAFCEGDPGLPETVARLAEDGAGRILVVPLAVTDNYPCDLAQRAVDALRPAEHGVEVVYGSPLWAAAGLAERLAALALEAAGTLEDAGVVVACGGQPDQWDTLQPRTLEEETVIAQRVRAALLAGGLHEERVRLAWTEWRSPDVTEAVRHLAALGAHSIAIVPVTEPAPSFATRIDLPQGAAMARASDQTDVTVVDGWGTDDEIVRVAGAHVRRALDEA